MSNGRMGFMLCASLVLALVVPMGPGAARAETPAETPAEIRAGYVDDITNAYALADFAAKYKSPEAYIAAAGLLLKVEAQSRGKMGAPPKELTIIDGNEKETKGEVKELNLKAQTKAWFSDARDLAAEAKLSKEVESLIKAAEKRNYEEPADEGMVSRCRKTGGPASVTRVIQPNETHVYKWTFTGQQLAAVGMGANGTIGIKIISPNGASLFDQVGGRAGYRWEPKKTDTYTVRIHNGSKNPVNYILSLNQ